MSWTFGGANSNDMNWATQTNVGSASSAFLVCGWWRPTALNNPRSYFSFGNVITARVAPTTSEIQLVSDNATTDGVWTTSGAGIVTNAWHFLAVLGIFASGGVIWRVWKSTGVDSPPALISNTNTTAPVGAPAGSGAFYLGNAGTSTANSFQGQIGSCSLYTVPGSALPNPLRLTSFTALSTDEEAFILNEYVIPAWLGEPFPAVGNHSVFGGTPPTWQMAHFDLEQVVTPRPFVWGNSTFSPAGTAATIQGATFSQERPPVVAGPKNTNPFPGFRRR